MWVTITAFVTGLAYLLRAPKTALWHPVSRFVVAGFCFWGCAQFWAGGTPVSLIQYAGAGVIVTAAGVYLLDFFVRIFSKAARAVLKHFESGPVLPHYVAEIVKTMEQLAGTGTGALMVLERKDSLNPFLEGGIRFDGEIKSEILLALFNESSPVHDGAVVVTGGRIRKVKAILPLSTARPLPMGIGTRHRSAIGISERTDAIVFVVSEERGDMSIAYRGELVKAKNPKELRALSALALKGKELKLKT